MSTKKWGKLGFVPAKLPWELDGADILDVIAFGGAAHQLGIPFALRMWKHTAAVVAIQRDYPDDVEAQDVIREYLLSLDSRDATEYLAFYRSSRVMARNFGRPRNAKSQCLTFGLLPFGQAIDPSPVDDLPF